MGSYILQRENQERLFKNAQRLRHIIVDKMNELYKEYDAMILPASGGVAPLFGEEIDRMSDRYLVLENHMVIANFGGFPSITIPSGFVSGMPIGVNITGRCFEDGLTLNIANKIEEKLGYKGLIKEEFDV